MRDGVRIFKCSKTPYSSRQFATGYTIHLNSLFDKGHIEGNAVVVDALVDMVFIPNRVGYGKVNEALLYLHFGFNVPGVVGFEAFPLVWGIGWEVACTTTIAFRRLTRNAEILYKVFTFGELLFVEL